MIKKWEALGLLVCVLKRLNIFNKIFHHGPGGQNGPNFLSACFPHTLSPLSSGPYLHAGNLFSVPWDY